MNWTIKTFVDFLGRGGFPEYAEDFQGNSNLDKATHAPRMSRAEVVFDSARVHASRFLENSFVAYDTPRFTTKKTKMEKKTKTGEGGEVGGGSSGSGTTTTLIDELVAGYTPPYNRDALAVCYEALPELSARVFQRRFYLLGARLGGSAWHIDKLNSSFFNTVVSGGAKHWVLLPPDIDAPVGTCAGEADKSHMAQFQFQRSSLPAAPNGSRGYLAHDSFFSPRWRSDQISPWEWWRTWRYIARRRYGCRMLETTVRPGETLFVPPGWWHMVLNLDDNLAISENWVAPSDLAETKAVMRDIVATPSELWRCPSSDEPGCRARAKRVLSECLRLLDTSAGEAA